MESVDVFGRAGTASWSINIADNTALGVLSMEDDDRGTDHAPGLALSVFDGRADIFPSQALPRVAQKRSGWYVTISGTRDIYESAL